MRQPPLGVLRELPDHIEVLALVELEGSDAIHETRQEVAALSFRQLLDVDARIGVHDAKNTARFRRKLDDGLGGIL